MKVIGRDIALSELTHLIAEEQNPCVTLWGPGGVGKTTLARLFQSSHAAPTLFADLSASLSLESAASKIALELAVPLKSASSTEAIVEQLASALDTELTPLLILDNCEQALAPVSELLSALRVAVPHLQVLATSREPLGIEGERPYSLPFLDEGSALQLFVQSAQKVAPDFSLDAEDDAERAKALVNTLDLLPLAIELAAARLEVMTLEQLSLRLDDQLRILQKAGTREGRHSTLRNTIEWSWALLDEGERQCLAQCGVFHDGFTLEAAESIVSVEDWVTDGLHSLMRKSLLTRLHHKGQTRFRLMESVRAFALEQLSPKQKKRVLKAHAEYFSNLDRPWVGIHKDAKAALTLELENIMAAHQASEDPRERVQSAIVLAPFFAAQGPPQVQSRVLDAGVKAAEELKDDPTLCVQIHLQRAQAHRVHARLDDAAADLEHCDALLKPLETKGESSPLRLEHDVVLGTVHFMLGQYEIAKGYLEKAFAQEGIPGAGRWVGLARHRYGSILMSLGDDAKGEQSLLRAQALLESAEDDSALGSVNTNLAVIYLDRGQSVEAAAALDRAEAFSSSVGDRLGLASVVVNRGLLALNGGQFSDAEECFANSLREAVLLADKRLEAYCRMCMGITSHLLGRLPQAQVRLSAAIEQANRANDIASLCGAKAHLGAILFKCGDEQGAAELFEEAGEIAAKFPHPWFRRVVNVLQHLRTPASVARVYMAETPDLPTHVRLAKVLVKDFHSGKSVASKEELALGSSRLVVGEEARWLVLPGGEKLDLQRRGPLRRMLYALAQKHGKGALDVNAMIEAGWPGDKIHHESGAARVYAAVRTLRRLGLEPYLQTRDDGYLLDPTLTVELA